MKKEMWGQQVVWIWVEINENLQKKNTCAKDE